MEETLESETKRKVSILRLGLKGAFHELGKVL
jgi:hypothetical protein